MCIEVIALFQAWLIKPCSPCRLTQSGWRLREGRDCELEEAGPTEKLPSKQSLPFGVLPSVGNTSTCILGRRYLEACLSQQLSLGLPNNLVPSVCPRTPSWLLGLPKSLVGTQQVRWAAWVQDLGRAIREEGGCSCSLFQSGFNELMYMDTPGAWQKAFQMSYT